MAAEEREGIEGRLQGMEGWLRGIEIVDDSFNHLVSTHLTKQPVDCQRDTNQKTTTART